MLEFRLCPFVLSACVGAACRLCVPRPLVLWMFSSVTVLLLWTRSLPGEIVRRWNDCDRGVSARLQDMQGVGRRGRFRTGRMRGRGYSVLCSSDFACISLTWGRFQSWAEYISLTCGRWFPVLGVRLLQFQRLGTDCRRVSATRKRNRSRQTIKSATRKRNMPCHARNPPPMGLAYRLRQGSQYLLAPSPMKLTVNPR